MGGAGKARLSRGGGVSVSLEQEQLGRYFAWGTVLQWARVCGGFEGLSEGVA